MRLNLLLTGRLLPPATGEGGAKGDHCVITHISAPLVRRNRQGVAKTCNYSRSALTQKVIIQNVKIFIIAKYFLMATSGQLRNLGSRRVAQSADARTR